jgi:hypothetical protein
VLEFPKMKKIQVIWLLILPLVFLAQEKNTKQSLYINHAESSGKGTFKQRIFAYHFLNGSYTGREEVISFDGKKDGKDFIRTDRGANTLYKDKYLITGIGNIIDLKEKKILFDGKASLIRCSNDSAIFYTHNVFKGKFYSIYDFKKNEYRAVKDLLFKPKYARDVEFDKSAIPFKLIYYPTGKPKLILTSDAGFGQQGTKDKSFVPDPPMHWIDTDNFIYVYFNKENSEFSIVRVNIDSKSSKLIGKQSMTSESVPASFIKLSSDQLILNYGNKQFLLNLKTETLLAMDQSYPENGFNYEFNTDQKGRVVKLNDKEIGKFHFETTNFSTGENTAALVKELRIGAETYQQGLMVWNNSKLNWQAVDADEVLTLIGWMKD